MNNIALLILRIVFAGSMVYGHGLGKLTRLIEGNDYWISQVYDSIWPFKENSNINFDNRKFIDIGSGCGFPGFAYAITHPNSEIYLVDSSKKKTD